MTWFIHNIKPKLNKPWFGSSQTVIIVIDCGTMAQCIMCTQSKAKLSFVRCVNPVTVITSQSFKVECLGCKINISWLVTRSLYCKVYCHITPRDQA